MLGRMTVPKEERLVLFDFDDEEDDMSASEKALSEEKRAVFDKDKKKWPSVEADENIRNEIHSMLHKFGDDIYNSFLEKRRKAQIYSETVATKSSYKIKQIWKNEQRKMLMVKNNYYKQFMDLIKQWKMDKQRYETRQENLIAIYQQLRSMLRQYKIKQKQRMRLITKMALQYTEIMKSIDRDYDILRTTSLTVLKEEIAERQMKYMIETQKQEIANIRNSLHSIIYE